MKSSLLRTLITALTCVGVSSSVLVGGAQPALAEGAEVSGDTCADVTVLGVRSSVNEENGFALAINPNAREYMPEAPQDAFGLGNSYSANELAKILPDGTTYKKVPVAYESYQMTGIYDQESLTAFRNSVTQGKNATVDAAAKTVENCSDTKLVVIGSGHGAQIAHEAVSSFPKSTYDRLAGVWLIGDPIANVDDQNQQRYAGGAALPTNSGSRLEILSQVPNDPTIPLRKQQAPQDTTFPDFLTGKVVSVCSDFDIFCSASTGASDYPAAAYYMSSTFSDVPSRFIADTIAKLQDAKKVVPTPTPTPTSDKCADVIFVAARGSGEDENAGQPLQNSSKENHMKGYGDTIATMAYQVKSYMDKSVTTSMEYVEYQALSVPEAMDPMPSRYPKSVNTGIYGGADFKDEPSRLYEGGVKSLKERIADCPDSRFMTMGYSQGSHAMHEIMMQLDRPERDRIKASILIADAIRNAEDGSKSLAFFGAGESVAAKDSVIYQGNGVMRWASYADQVCVDLTESVSQRNNFFGNAFKAIITIPAVNECNKVFPTDTRFTDVTTPKPFESDLNQKILNVCSTKDIVCQIKKPDGVDVASFAYAVFSILKEGEAPSSCKDVRSGYVVELCHNAENVDEIHGNGYKENSNFYVFPGKWAAEKLLS